MISKLTLRNFKNVREQVYDFTEFDLLVGRNNSGKSTVLQALAIWQFCVDEFHRSKRAGTKGIQVVLPNFTALPVPVFNYLWKDRTDREYPIVNGKKKQKYILIEILVEWKKPGGETDSFGVELRYQTSQSIYAIPMEGWKKFRACEEEQDLPRIAYVPPFSGLEPSEKWLDISPIRQQVGKAQPGSVLRNLLLSVCPSPPLDHNGRIQKGYEVPEDWVELKDIVRRWFSVELHEPQYGSERDVDITVEYKQNGKDYDIIAGGSGFHQALTLLAFLYGYKPTTILLDEPDAHLHVNLQREILGYFKQKSYENNTQFLIATHAEEFVRGVDAGEIVSLLDVVPKRIESKPEVIRAMAEVTNEDITRLMASPYIIYVEGEDDERILRAWADKCEAINAMGKVCFKTMDGGDKQKMNDSANEHYRALKQIIPNVRRLILFDYDTEDSYHPESDNPSLCEWKRKNIENYLLVPDAWKRAASQILQSEEGDLYALPVQKAIDGFFADENLTLSPNRTWRDVSANVFGVVDGKRILFENDNSLFHRLRKESPSAKIPREYLARSMKADELHEDVHDFIKKIVALVKPDEKPN